MFNKIVILLIIAIGFTFAGVEDELKAINEKLDKINTRLDKIEKKVAAPAQQNNKKQADPNAVYDIPISGSVVLGNPNAKVTILEFTDFQWPYCAKSVSLIDDILEKYPNDVKVVIKNFPLSFHKQAKRASQYALAAHEQGKYKELAKAIFADYKKLKANEDLPLELAQNLGLDMEQFVKDFSSQKVKDQLDLEMKQFTGAGFPRPAVPKFLIQGKEPQGKRDLASFSAIIDAELAKLKK